MKLSIIIVSYNTREVIQECLESIELYYNDWLKKKSLEVIVVDNASIDGSDAHIREHFPWAEILLLKENSGFAKANNKGIEKTTGKYILFLNPDTKLFANSLSPVLDYMEAHPEVGIATAKVLLPSGQLDDACHRGFPTPWRALTHFSGMATLFSSSQFINGYHLGYKNLDRPHEIDACAGAFLLIRRTVGDEVGWFDEGYFWYGEDLDVCFRVKQKGHKIMFIPMATVFHYKGAASGIKKHSQHLSKIDEQTRKKITKARFEVMRTFYRKHYATIYPKWLTNLVFTGIDLKQKLTERSV